MKEWIAGRNPVYEAFQARRRHFFRLRVAAGSEEKGRLLEIMDLARKLHLPLERVHRQQLDAITEHHQGVALETSVYPYSDLPAILQNARSRAEPLFVLLLDLIQDPQNLGALIRSAEAWGVHGLVMPLRQSASVTPAVVHASAGASEHLLIAQANLAQAISTLKEAGAWILGLEFGPDSQPIEQAPLAGPLALVVGSEGEGLRSLTRKSCDLLVALPMKGKVQSVNAAVAGSLALYLSYQARTTRGK
jgi:23S rRNA (guanosine2251-2'-O)-methyltransferase